jgi:hypothetical protein
MMLVRWPPGTPDDAPADPWVMSVEGNFYAADAARECKWVCGKSPEEKMKKLAK